MAHTNDRAVLENGLVIDANGIVVMVYEDHELSLRESDGWVRNFTSGSSTILLHSRRIGSCAAFRDTDMFERIEYGCLCDDDDCSAAFIARCDDSEPINTGGGVEGKCPDHPRASCGIDGHYDATVYCSTCALPLCAIAPYEDCPGQWEHDLSACADRLDARAAF